MPVDKSEFFRKNWHLKQMPVKLMKRICEYLSKCMPNCLLINDL